MNALSLTDIQKHFSSALLEPSSAPDAASLFCPHPYQQDRLALYRGNLTAIWTSALKNAFPVLYQLVGEAYFEQLARAFGRARPSLSGDLNQFGAKLAEFLKSIPDASDYPYFPDIAALEWQIHNAYYAADADVLSLAELLQAIAAGGQDLQTVQLQLHPAVSLYRSEWDSVSIWLAHQAHSERELPENIQQICHGLIYRRDWSVELQALDQPAWLALSALTQGRGLGEALEVALDVDAEFAINAHLQSWFAAGLFVKHIYSA
ncbi:putative DNA-binding domain-containing protein [Undibacterium sp. Di27W]|uniref:HvfC/BufC family peptide modification chaperone n=1 Tax=Undibacterium sp. Di27W TaxID=3413036 RepID=UPI003BF0EE50